MKFELLNYKRISYLLILVSIVVITSNNTFSKDLKEFKKAFKNGKPLIESKKVAGLDKVFNITTYYDNDKVMKTEQWSKGKRNGITKVFNKDGSLMKEVKFKDNYVLDYKGYKDGRIETQISEDRRTIINRGKTLSIRWNKYYEIWGGGIIVSFDSKALINYLLNFVVPEEATEVLSDITDHFDKIPGAGQSGNDDMVTCGGSTNLFKDNGIDLRNAPTATSSNAGSQFSKGISTNKGKVGSGNLSTSSSTMTSTISNLLNTCSNNYRSSVGGTGGLGNNKQRQNDINKARGALDQTIAGCNSRKGGFRSLFSADPTTMFKSLQVLEALEAAEVGASATQVTSSVITESASVVVDQTVKTAALNAAEGSAVRGFVTAGVSSAIAGVMTAAVVGWAVGTFINDNTELGKSITDAIAKWQEENDEQYQQAKKEADEAQKAAEARAAAKAAEEEKKKNEGKTETPGGSTPPTTSIPVPDDIGAGDACERAERFKAYCDRTDWKDMRCENYIRMVKKCVGDIREIYVSPEGGNVMSVGCPSSGDPAALQELECKRRGMIAISGGDGPRGICANRNIQPPLLGPDQNVINPSRGNFSIMNLPGKNVSFATDNDAATLLKSSKPTLIVFADPDCGYCNDMGNTLKSKSVSTALATYDVKIVDINMNPKLANQFGVSVIPSYFVAKDGKKTDLRAGALGEKDMQNYLNENKNGPSSKK